MMALEDVGGSMCESHLPRWAVAKPASISPTPPSLAGTRLPPARNLVRVAAIPPYASISLVDQRNGVASIHMRCRITAIFLATATLAFL